MLNVQVREDYATILAPLQESVDEALRRYALEKARAQLMELEQRLQKHEDKYGCSYDLFAYRTTTDEEYVRRLDVSPVTQQWEGDLISWEFDTEELREWQRRAQPARESGPTWDSASRGEWSDGADFAHRVIANNGELFDELARL